MLCCLLHFLPDSMKRFSSLLCLTLILAACGGVSASYDVTFQRVTADQATELGKAIERMVESRAVAMEKKMLSKKFTGDEKGGTLTIRISDEEGAHTLTELITRPFSFQLMTQAELGKGKIKTEKHGEYNPSGLNETHVDWVKAQPPQNGYAKVTIDFTPEGKTLLQKIFAENQGKLIGVFVRESLMSVKLVNADDLTRDSIIIDNVPSAQIASAFADDVNVSVHATFTKK